MLCTSPHTQIPFLFCCILAITNFSSIQIGPTDIYLYENQSDDASQNHKTVQIWLTSLPIPNASVLNYDVKMENDDALVEITYNFAPDGQNRFDISPGIMQFENFELKNK